MSRPVLKVAVVGHTNTGKTSLLRTLTRDAGFGEVSNRPATTRHVEGTALLVEGETLAELYDTPGLEDSIGLLEHLDTLRTDRHADWVDILRRFLDSPAARNDFEQEAKVLRQVLASQVALYVVDVRERMLGKHRDELEILGRTARPVMPVLNFVASPEARTAQWREHLSRVNMHVAAEFDTVVLDENGERRLFEKLQTLLDPFRETLEALIEDRNRQRRGLIQASADLLADLLIDVAAYTVVVPLDTDRTAFVEHLKKTVRDREQHCVEALLELHRFRPGDYAARTLPIAGGRWGLDPFSPASLRQFGVRTGGGAAAGAATGLAIDVLAGGATLGAGTAIGAALGALLGGTQTQARRLADRLRGFTQLQVADDTLRVLAVRQIELIRALLQRGHASQDRIDLGAAESGQSWAHGKLPAVLQNARINPRWSRLGSLLSGSAGNGAEVLDHNPAPAVDFSATRAAARSELAGIIEQSLLPADGAEVE